MDELTRLPGEPASRGTGLGTVAGPDRSPSSPEWGRFTPGTIFAERFRIVAPLGRGGMGEVYRADDLKLGQTVALKLLPDHLAADPARLAQFHNEVRVARTISHRNVCRTYDIGDADGQPFLTMEYVDGEDLASLLRRIGRFPQDKAVEVARQICAGLAAAHERGVLHRDLKPANVMIDGEGHVRITDFGLAAIAGTVDNIRAGTPAYMAPEQLAGREVTQRSDVYALGLVLFELFTGKRVFEASTLNDLMRLHETGSVATPSSHVRDLDPAIERVILRCLEREPSKRPASALSVSAALPGGDPLAAALAAGETPSPEMVAAAGEQSALKPAIGLGLLVFTVLMLGLLAALSQRFSVIHRVPFPRSTDSLKDRAQELIEQFGYRDAPYDSAAGWELNREYLNSVPRGPGADGWPALASGRTRTASFWYRTGPATLVPSTDAVTPTLTDPPLLMSDMRVVRLDPHGRLIEFHSIPPQVEDPPPTPPPPAVNWSALFAAAGLPQSSFREIEPRWTARGDADARLAWEGPLPDVPGATVRVEAASYRGRPIMFNVLPPWTVPSRMVLKAPAKLLDRLFTTLAVSIGYVLLAVAAVVARRNLRNGRGDRQGAFRTAAVMFVFLAAGLLVRARHYTAIDVEANRSGTFVALSLYLATVLWLFYIGLEPYVRRFWPQLLIGWTRLLSGRVRDPLVGRDILVGVAAGTIAALLIASRTLIPRLVGLSPPAAGLPSDAILLGGRHDIALALQTVRPALIYPMQCVCIVVFYRILVKRAWLVMLLSTVTLLPIAMSGTFFGEQPFIEIGISIVGIALVFGVLLRFGLLALVMTFYTFQAMGIFPLTTDLSRPYAGASIALLALITAMSAYGFYASRGDEPLFGRTLFD